VRDLLAAGEPGRHGDGDGLWLTVGAAGRGSWALRYTSPLTGKARELGLGKAEPDTKAPDLAAVRGRAADAGRLLRERIDPLQQRRAKAGAKGPRSAVVRDRLLPQARVVPAERMKGKREHAVPLSNPAMTV